MICGYFLSLSKQLTDSDPAPQSKMIFKMIFKINQKIIFKMSCLEQRSVQLIVHVAVLTSLYCTVHFQNVPYSKMIFKIILLYILVNFKFTSKFNLLERATLSHTVYCTTIYGSKNSS